MGDASGIQWTDATWNPVTGCTRVSAGCDNCYAARQAAGRLKNTDAYRDLAVFTPSGRAAFNGTIRLLPERLDQPLRWTRPRRIFVNSMSDLFHPDVPDWFIDQAFAVMTLANWHTYQVLTKRPHRMYRYMTDPDTPARVALAALTTCLEQHTRGRGDRVELTGDPREEGRLKVWPLHHIWMGTSVEDQPAAEQRLPWLVETPAAVRFVSCEPLLGPVDMARVQIVAPKPPHGPGAWLNTLTGHAIGPDDMTDLRVQWVIVGGESGPRARPFDLGWARSVVAQCREADVPVFVKQLGARPVTGRYDFTGVERDPIPLRLRDRSGGAPAEWPEDLRVREFPRTETAAGRA